MHWTEDEFHQQRWAFIQQLLAYFSEKYKRQSNGK
jgi:hypothetical protein